MTPAPVADIIEAKPLAIFADSITTDHISPAGSIKATSPAGKWLLERQVMQADFNSYGARRGHHEVMMRGTFANIRIKNLMLDGVEGGMTSYKGETMPIYDAAMAHQAVDKAAGAAGEKAEWLAERGTSLNAQKEKLVSDTCSYVSAHPLKSVGMAVLAGFLLSRILL